MKVIIHLGAYKTGTSSFQNWMYRNRGTFKQAGVLYPETGLLVQDKLGCRHRRLSVVPPKEISSRHRILLKEIKHAECDTVVLSSEAWSIARNLYSLHSLIRFLEAHGIDDVQGFIVLRNVVAYQVSHYREFTIN
jgi:hypothetical protein